MLHPEFEEVGRSGRRYDLTDTVENLPTEARRALIANGFRLVRLAEDMALLHYHSHEGVTAAGNIALATLRTSLWQRVGQQWLLRVHQGTPQATDEDS